MKQLAFALLTCLGFLTSDAMAGGETPSNPQAQGYIVNLDNGAVVSSPFTVVFGLSGMGVAPAGTDKAMTGHHHLLIDVPPFGQGEDGAEQLESSIPADENHIHFGGGQTETVLDLPKGIHTLQLVLGDLNHVPHSPPVVSDVITITVN